jgi:ABC-type transport system substrate-binding protein
MNKKNIVLALLVVILINCSFYPLEKEKTNGISAFFDVTLVCVSDWPYTDYANFLKQHIARIGVGVNIELEEWKTFNERLHKTRDFDLILMEQQGYNNDYYSLPLNAFTENGSLNCWGYHTDMDYDEDFDPGINEWYIEQGNLFIPHGSDDSILHAWDWQNYMQTNILPMKPFFAPPKQVVYWSNLVGFNNTEGLRQSWGKMSWDGLHTSQTASNALVIADYPWLELNPFFCLDKASKVIIENCLDTLFAIDADKSVWPNIAKNWTWVDDTTLDIAIRPGIKWLDYDIYIDEFLDVNDVYFSLLCWKLLSKKQTEFFWLKDLEKIDNETLRIHIDGDPKTITQEPYAATLFDLATWIAPEHFLNQSQMSGVLPYVNMPDITHSSWIDYSSNVWGTNVFELGCCTQSETTLIHNQGSWHLNSTTTSDPTLDYTKRFGDYSGGLDTLIIRNISNQQSILYEFEDGRVDLADVSYFQDYKDKYLADATKALQSDIKNSFQCVGFNMRPIRCCIGDPEPSPLDPTISKGLAVRKAIAYAINRVEINNVMHNGESVVWDYPNYPTFGFWNNPNIIRYNFNLDRSREFLTKAGYDSCPIYPQTIWEEYRTIIITFGIITPSLIITAISIALGYVFKKKKRRI